MSAHPLFLAGISLQPRMHGDHGVVYRAAAVDAAPVLLDPRERNAGRLGNPRPVIAPLGKARLHFF